MKKILILAVVAVLLSAGLVLASCDSGGCPGGASSEGGNCNSKETKFCTSENCAVVETLAKLELDKETKCDC